MLATQSIQFIPFGFSKEGRDSSKERKRDGIKREFILRESAFSPLYSMLHALLASLGVYSNLAHKEYKLQNEEGITKGRTEDEVKRFDAEIFTF